MNLLCQYLNFFLDIEPFKFNINLVLKVKQYRVNYIE